MDKLINSALSIPVATLFIVTGILFLFIAVIGKISGKIEPSKKSRIASGILGFVFILGGLAMHLKQEVESMPKTATNELKLDRVKSITQITPLEKDVSSGKIIVSKETSNNTIDDSTTKKYLTTQTIFDGVIAIITRFENTGGLVTLELQIINKAPKEVAVCANYEALQYAKIIDETSGNSWRPDHHGGEIDCSDKIKLDHNKSHLIWMKFNIKNPEDRKFTLTSNVLKRPLEGLTLTP